MRISLQVAAGTWSAEWGDERQEQPVCTVTGKTELLALPTRESILNRLRGFPLELYQLLQGEASEWIKRQLPLLILEDCSCGEQECRHATEALAVLEADPLLRLEAAGLSKAELLSGVFDEWARDRGRTSGSNPLERLAVDPSGEGRRGGAHSVSGLRRQRPKEPFINQAPNCIRSRFAHLQGRCLSLSFVM